MVRVADHACRLVGLSFHPKRIALPLVALGLLVASGASAQRHTPGYAVDDPDWRFTMRDRPVKVVILAGSIGAFRDRPYGRLLHEWCGNAEIRNISTVGAGAPQLLRRFQTSVLENPNVPVGWRGHELWLLYGGGLNSAGQPHLTNHATHRLLRMAHRRHVRVAMMTLTPWATDGETDPRWAGAGGLHALQSTQSIVDFIMGQSSPNEALGTYVRRRGRGIEPTDPWQAIERPDVAINLYDSRLRDADAEPWPVDRIAERLQHDPRWRRSTAELSEGARTRRLQQDAELLAQAPQYFLRPEYRGFDHIHPNRAGHQVIAETACPSLPRSWGCRCP